MNNLLKTQDFDYELPSEYIAQTPIEPRDAARLMVVKRYTGVIDHSTFREVGKFLRPGDLLVINQTRVIKARLFAHKIPSGGRVEMLLLRKANEANVWETLLRGKGLREGVRLKIELGPLAEIVAVLEGARRLVLFEEPIEGFLAEAGYIPLPPYIHNQSIDPERYQTIYAKELGSVAAPTAGLHFTEGLMKSLQEQNILFASVTLHIGLDTFAPVKEEDPKEHKMHSEWCQLPKETADLINQARKKGGRIIAVGTTSVRVLETAAQLAPPGEIVGPYEGITELFILPGFKFRVVDGMITNFHLPKSTLLMLVSAFAGREVILSAYETAKKEGYRFYSFGDAMLIL
jgi:S-adenosylmethionine:tRNA ribosyltransferase-isomerase